MLQSCKDGLAFGENVIGDTVSDTGVSLVLGLVIQKSCERITGGFWHIEKIKVRSWAW